MDIRILKKDFVPFYHMEEILFGYNAFPMIIFSTMAAQLGTHQTIMEGRSMLS